MATATDTLHRILYACRMTSDCEDDVDGVLADILAVSVPVNQAFGVTSMLLAHRGWFIGALEGEQPAVQAALERLGADGRHLGICTLSHGTPAERMFAGWSLCAWALSDDDAAVLSGFDEEDDFDATVVPERIVLRLLAVVAKAHRRRFDAQQRLTIRRA